MNSQIYLLLLRQSGSYKDWSEEFDNMNKVKAAMIAKQILKDIVMGDSLDAPFVKFIRVSSVSHNIGFGGESKFEKSGWAYQDAWKEETKTQYAPNPFLRSSTTTVANSSKAFHEGFGKRSAQDFWGLKKGDKWWKPKETGNPFVQSRIPEHGEIEFKKHVDSATPQLAYGCSAQEKFPLAIFFYRRKVGLGIGGIRFPYFVTAAFKCKIKDWSLGDDMESVSLYYKRISWCGYDQWADTNISYPWSTRWFDQEQFKGGQGGFAAGLQLLVAGLVLAAGGISAAATASDGVSSGSDADL